jgi:nucleotide-binding universal stress UspA family protein
MYTHLLVPIDGSDHSLRAVLAACQLAEAIDAKVTLFHAARYQFEPLYSEHTAFNLKYKDAFQQEAKRHAEMVLKKADAHANLKTDTHYALNNDPCRAIIEAATAHSCDLIVMASHGYRGLTGLLLGSETYKVLTHTKIPVLVVR